MNGIDDRHRALNRAWKKAKQDTRITQAQAGKMLGMNQSAFGQYLRGAIPLNTDFILSFSKMIGVKPDEIDPNLAEMPRKKVMPTVPFVPVRGATAPDAELPEKIMSEVTSIYEDTIAVRAANTMFPDGSYILASQSARKGCPGYVLRASGKHFELFKVIREKKRFRLLNFNSDFFVDSLDDFYVVIGLSLK